MSEAPRATIGALACAKAAAQATEAVALWVGKLSEEQCTDLHRRLLAKQEWTAARIFADAVEQKKLNKDGKGKR